MKLPKKGKKIMVVGLMIADKSILHNLIPLLFIKLITLFWLCILWKRLINWLVVLVGV